MEARIRTWPDVKAEQPKLLGYAGFKAACMRIASIDDREKTPNFGKQLVGLGTVVVTPPMSIIGIRGYSKDRYGIDSTFDVYAKDLPKELSRLFKTKQDEKGIEKAEKSLSYIDELYAIAAILPRKAGLEQKKPYVFEVAVKGGDIAKQFAFLKDLMGKEVKIDQVFQKGVEVDVAQLVHNLAQDVARADAIVRALKDGADDRADILFARTGEAAQVGNQVVIDEVEQLIAGQPLCLIFYRRPVAPAIRRIDRSLKFPSG